MAPATVSDTSRDASPRARSASHEGRPARALSGSRTRTSPVHTSGTSHADGTRSGKTDAAAPSQIATRVAVRDGAHGRMRHRANADARNAAAARKRAGKIVAD